MKEMRPKCFTEKSPPPDRAIERTNVSKTAQMVPNGAKRAPEMCEKHVLKDNHLVSKVMIAPITIASILQTHFIDSFVEQRVQILHIQFIASMRSQISNKTCFVAARASKQTHFSRWGAFL